MYVSKFAAMSFHNFLNTAVLPVKCSAAKSGWLIAFPTTSSGTPGTNWITPGGTPASVKIWYTR